MDSITEKLKFVAFTDGGYHYNEGVGASAYIVIDQDDNEVARWAKAYDHTTNNRCEIIAIMGAVRSVPYGSEIHIFTDSEYSIGLLTNNFGHVKANKDLYNQYKDIAQGKEVHFHWVKGHNGNKWNEIVDELCQTAIGIEVERAERERPKEFWEKYL